MSTGQIDFQDVLQLVELIKASSNFSEIKLRLGDVEVELRRGGGSGLLASTSAAAPAAAALATPVPVSAPVADEPGRLREGTQSNASPALAAATGQGRQAGRESHEANATSAREGMTIIKAPMVGTVYLAPEPGAPAFVKLGQAVAPGDQVCIVEVMKLMNSIDAGCRGVIAEILVADGEAVEHGQALFVISPAAEKRP